MGFAYRYASMLVECISLGVSALLVPYDFDRRPEPRHRFPIPETCPFTPPPPSSKVERYWAFSKCSLIM